MDAEWKINLLNDSQGSNLIPSQTLGLEHTQEKTLLSYEYLTDIGSTSDRFAQARLLPQNEKSISSAVEKEHWAGNLQAQDLGPC